MGAFFVYILKSSLCLAVFYLFYRLLLSKETFHRCNRIALLSIILLSYILPLATITTSQHTMVSTAVTTVEDLLIMYEQHAVPNQGLQPEYVFPWQEILIICYVAGAIFFILCHLWSLGRMLYFIRHNQHEQLPDGTLLIIHSCNFAPFSWMKYIVISQADLKENGHDILLHEQAHIRNHHSWDLLLVEVCSWLQWFNPAIWLLKQELQNIHEYEADEEVLRQGIDAKQYQMLLIKKAVGARLYSIANSFNHSSLKKRITMMIRKKSNPWAQVKYLYVLPLATVAVTVFARPEVSQPLEEISNVKVSDLSDAMKTYTDKNQQNNQSAPDKKIRLSMKVVDETGQPVPQATVVITNTSNGTLTDDDGHFSLEVGEDQSLWISYVGMESKNISVKDCIKQTDKTIRLTSATSELDLTVSPSAPKPAVQNGETFTVVEQMPEYPGGMKALMGYLAENIQYPAECQKASIQGRVIVQFVVKADGSLDNFEIKRSVNPLLDAEALRVIKTTPKWKPGTQHGKPVDVKFTIPVTFSLPDKQKEHTPTGNISDSSLTLKKTLFIIDGKEVEPKALNEINPNQISSINVIKDGTGVTIFGPKARDGVILITTKRSSTTSQGESLVTGRVTDAAGNPVSGACITIKGTTTQTTSDNEGRFTLTVPRKDATLEVSSSNMKTATVGAQPLLKVALEKE